MFCYAVQPIGRTYGAPRVLHIQSTTTNPLTIVDFRLTIVDCRGPVRGRPVGRKRHKSESSSSVRSGLCFAGRPYGAARRRAVRPAGGAESMFCYAVLPIGRTYGAPSVMSRGLSRLRRCAKLVENAKAGSSPAFALDNHSMGQY